MFGDATIETVRELVASGADHIALLMRHSAREFNKNVHDLVNPLTEEGRDLSRRLGEALPKSHTLRGYASPPGRCIETAQLALLGHASKGGEATRVRWFNDELSHCEQELFALDPRSYPRAAELRAQAPLPHTVRADPAVLRPRRDEVGADL